MTNNNLSIHSIKLEPDALSLTLLADIDFDHFEAFAEPLARALDCRVRERQWGADRHQWLLEFEGCQLWLHYEFYGDVCWLSTERQGDFEVLEYLAGLLRPYVN